MSLPVNPRGRPRVLTSDLRALLDEQIGQARVGELVVKELVRLALKSESEGIRLAAISEILDRVDGKPKQALLHHGGMTHDLRVKFGDRPPDFGEAADLFRADPSGSTSDARTIEAAASVVSNGVVHRAPDFAARNGSAARDGKF